MLKKISLFPPSLKTKLEETNPERVDAFVAGAVGAVKMILGKFKDFEVAIQGIDINISWM